MITPADIEKVCKFGKEKEIITKRGPRLLRSAMANEEFWSLWNLHQADLKPQGISISRDFDDASKWRVNWWKELPAEVVAERKQRVELSKAVDASINIPAPAGCEYMPFQKAGVVYALNCFAAANGCLIGDEAGVGKTMQGIGIINAVPEISRVLIICPMTLKANWQRELEKWLTRKLTIGHANSDFFPRTDIAIIHYEILHKFTTRLSNYWDLMIVDECHRCKNSKARQTRCIVGYKPSRKEAAAGAVPTSGIPARRKLMLSGTPFENKPAELWPIISYLAPTLFSSKSAFERRYCGATNDGWGYKSDGATNLSELAEKLRGCCMIRRLKRDVLGELPPKRRQIVEMDTDGFEDIIRREQAVWHMHEDDLEEAQVKLELAKASDDESVFKNSVSALRQKTAMIFTEMAKVRHETAVAKTPKMIEMLREEMEEINKMVVFFHHSDVGKTVAKAFGDECVIITGETSQEDRDPLVQRFQNDPKCRIFLGSIRATGEGITLTAASNVRFLENDWTASKMSQCSDRCHRKGQKDNVLVKYYVLPGTIDAHMIQTWIRKEEILEQALDSEREEVAAEPTLVPKAEPIATRKEIERESISLTEANRWAIMAALKHLARVCDGANKIDGQGFSKLDSAVGKSLASQSKLTPRQAALGLKLCLKYKRQLGEDLISKCGVKL